MHVILFDFHYHIGIVYYDFFSQPKYFIETSKVQRRIHSQRKEGIFPESKLA